MPKFEPVLLARINRENSASLESYRQDGGYGRLKEILSSPPIDVINTVKDSGCEVAEAPDSRAV